MTALKTVFAYIRKRLGEHTTYVLIGAGITSAAALPSPWNYVLAAISILGAMFPDGAAK